MKSIFDGWTKQIKHVMRDHKGGFCAHGWLVRRNALREVDRIGNWIIANMDPPRVWQHAHDYTLRPGSCPIAAIVWANNEGLLDIEGFKMVDLLSQGYIPKEATNGNQATTRDILQHS
jgi:hypothetical protein